MVRSREREPFKFWWAPTISLERLKLESSNFACR